MRKRYENIYLAKIEPQGNGGSPPQVEALVAQGLSCQRGGRVVVPDLNFEVKCGSALILRGPNGSGKTTLLRTIAGYLSPAAGRIEVRWHEQSPLQDEGAYHYIGHANGIKPRLTVIENIIFWQHYYGGGADIERAEAALEAFDLLYLASFSAGHLSQGQGRRLGLARLLAARRPIWLLDEPSVSLDAASTRLLEHVIAGHLAEGGLSLISTHLELAVPNASVLELGTLAVLQ